MQRIATGIVDGYQKDILVRVGNHASVNINELASVEHLLTIQTTTDLEVDWRQHRSAIEESDPLRYRISRIGPVEHGSVIDITQVKKRITWNDELRLKRIE